MSVYLYNLLFSLSGSDFSAGRFQQYNSGIANPTILNQSSAWFTYLPAGTPFGLGDYYAAVTSPLNPGDWGHSQSDSGALQLSPGDYLMMRVGSPDSNARNYQTRFTGVFARGTSQVLPAGAGDLQSPLVMSTSTVPSTYPRAVIDMDGTSGGSWPGPIASDNSWVAWLGMAHAAPGGASNDYILNVGISVYTGANYYTFGKDPRMRVGGMKKKIAA